MSNLTGVSNVLLTGRKGTILRLISESPIITFKGKRNFFVQNFTIDGANICGGSGIRILDGSYNFTVRNNFFQDINKTAINVELTEVGQQISGFVITNNTFTRCQDATVRVFGITCRRDISEFQITKNKMLEGFDNGKIAIAFAREGLIAQNEIYDTEHGIATRSVSSITIEANNIRNTTGRALYLGTNVGDVSPDNVTIRGNTIAFAGIGLSRWYGSQAHRNIVICGNIICNSSLLDILVDFPAIFVNNTITSRGKLEILIPSAKFVANKDMANKLIMPSDLNGDLKTDIRDIGLMAKVFGSVEGAVNWNPVADIIHDGKVDIKDLSFSVANFGQAY